MNEEDKERLFRLERLHADARHELKKLRLEFFDLMNEIKKFEHHLEEFVAYFGL